MRKFLTLRKLYGGHPGSKGLFPEDIDRLLTAIQASMYWE